MLVEAIVVFLLALQTTTSLLVSRTPFNPQAVRFASQETLDDWELGRALKDSNFDRPSSLREPVFWDDKWEQWYKTSAHVDVNLVAKEEAPNWILGDIKGVRPFSVCTPPRVGCSRWKRLARRIAGYKDYMQNPHNSATNGLRMAGKLSLEKKLEFWSTPKVFKIMLARNPIERILSAYLSKKRQYQLASTFEAFVMTGLNQTLGREHWAPMTEVCDSPAKLHYDFVARTEDRDIWMPQLVDFLRIHEYHDRGWGEKNGSWSHAETTIGSMTTSASRVDALRHHYTPELFRHVCSTYKQDVDDLGYRRDTERLWTDVFEGSAGELTC